MATLDLKLSQSVYDKLSSNPVVTTNANNIFDSIVSLNYLIASSNPTIKSYTHTPNSVTFHFFNGATEKLVGTLYPYDAYSGSAVVTSKTYSIPNVINITSSGQFLYSYSNYGSLSFNSTLGVINKASYNLLVSDPTLGKLSLNLEGLVAFNSSSQDFSGNLTKISLTASKFLKSLTFEGNLSVSGNEASIASGLSSTNVGGFVNAYNELYQDGSYIKINGNGSSLAYDAQLLSNPNNWAGNDTVKLDFPARLNSDVLMSIGAGDDNISVKGGGNRVTIDAGDGNDTIKSIGGGHIVFGGLGDDTYIVDSTSDSINEIPDQGTDTVQASVSYSLANVANVENLTLTGTKAINAIGSEGNNIIMGNAGANVINGGAGDDTLNGGAGNDVYIISASSDHGTGEIQDASGAADVIRFTSAILNDTLTVFASDTGIEQVVISDVAGITSGTASVNVDASLASNKLKITGNAGDNIITSSLFIDTLIGGAGNDTYVINNTTDVITEAASPGSGTDLVQAYVNYTLPVNVENLLLLDGASNGIGNASSNQLTGNGFDNILNGMAGADNMVGGLGNDTYIVDNVGDTIVEVAGEGQDGVLASISFSLAAVANVEDLSLTGAKAINAIGSDVDNIITGNAGANIIDGGAGDDTLNGGAGNDVIKGGAGNDRLIGGSGKDYFVFDTTPDANFNLDTIADFKVSGADKIELSHVVFDQLLSIDPTAKGVALNAADFFSGASVNESSSTGQHLLYNSSTGALYYDADGSGSAAAIEIGLIGTTSHPVITSTDFLVIL